VNHGVIEKLPIFFFKTKVQYFHTQLYTQHYLQISLKYILPDFPVYLTTPYIFVEGNPFE
jgi:hypothetical protein